jgi:hypothetical protein
MSVISRKALFEINISAEEVLKVSMPAAGSDFDTYLEDLVTQIQSDKSGRNFQFPAHSTGIKSVIATLADKKEDAAFADAADRLLVKEIAAQEKIKQLNVDIQKGLLIQALVSENKKEFYIIAKAEHRDFIEEVTFKKLKGLPFKKKIFKSFIAELDSKRNPVNAWVDDTNESIARYWWDDYLELVEVYDDFYNTKRAFDVIDNAIFAPLQKEAKQDYMALRNATIHLFRTSDSFNYDEYVKRVIKKYKPVNKEKVDIERIVERMKDLPEKRKFDRRFDIEPGEIRAKFKKDIPLTPEMDLRIKQDINLKNDVKALEENGNKYIRIRTDIGYAYFQKLE